MDEAVRDLAMIGLDRVAGFFGSEVVGNRAEEGREVAAIPQITSEALAKRMRAGHVAVLDVRGRYEWEAGRIPGVENIPLGYLTERLDDIPRDRPLVVHCQSGARSAIAASILLAQGLTNVLNLTGGFAEWQNAGHPVERGAGELVGAT